MQQRFRDGVGNGNDAPRMAAPFARNWSCRRRSSLRSRSGSPAARGRRRVPVLGVHAAELVGRKRCRVEQLGHGQRTVPVLAIWCTRRTVCAVAGHSQSEASCAAARFEPQPGRGPCTVPAQRLCRDRAVQRQALRPSLVREARLSAIRAAVRTARVQRTSSWNGAAGRSSPPYRFTMGASAQA